MLTTKVDVTREYIITKYTTYIEKQVRNIMTAAIPAVIETTIHFGKSALNNTLIIFLISI